MASADVNQEYSIPHASTEDQQAQHILTLPLPAGEVVNEQPTIQVFAAVRHNAVTAL